MRSSWIKIVVLYTCVTALPVDAGTVTVSLTSPLHESFVVCGTPIPWTIRAHVSDDDNYGLALISVDLMQDEWNPEPIDIAQADTVPEEMSFFDRPYGLANPPPPGATSGYLGTPVNEVSQHGLSQIGGAQDTFGTAGKTGSGTLDIIPGVGQSPDGQVIASGFISSPISPGTYRFRIEAVLANTLSAVNEPPAFSPTSSATVVLDAYEFAVHVCVPGDLDGDGYSGIVPDDVETFVLALLEPEAANPQTVCAADMNADGETNGLDVAAFVDALIGGGIATPPPQSDRPQTLPKD